MTAVEAVGFLVQNFKSMFFQVVSVQIFLACFQLIRQYVERGNDRNIHICCSCFDAHDLQCGKLFLVKKNSSTHPWFHLSHKEAGSRLCGAASSKSKTKNGYSNERLWTRLYPPRIQHAECEQSYSYWSAGGHLL